MVLEKIPSNQNWLPHLQKVLNQVSSLTGAMMLTCAESIDDDPPGQPKSSVLIIQHVQIKPIQVVKVQYI